MLRLKVNVRKLKAGALVSAEALGATFAAQLVAADQAEIVADQEPADPVEAVLHRVAQFFDQVRSANEVMTSVVAMAAALEADERVRVATAIVEAMRQGQEVEGVVELISLATDQTINPSGDGVSGAPAPGSDGTGGAEAADSQAVTPTGNADGADGAGTPPLGKPAPDDKPPTDAGSSGEADGASAPSVEPAKAPKPKPAGKSAGAAKGKVES